MKSGKHVVFSRNKDFLIRSVSLLAVVVLSLALSVFSVSDGYITVNAVEYGQFTVNTKGSFNDKITTSSTMNARYKAIADMEYGDADGTCEDTEYFYAVVENLGVGYFLGWGRSGGFDGMNYFGDGTQVHFVDPTKWAYYFVFSTFVWRFEYESSFDSWYIEPAWLWTSKECEHYDGSREYRNYRLFTAGDSTANGSAITAYSSETAGGDIFLPKYSWKIIDTDAGSNNDAYNAVNIATYTDQSAFMNCDYDPNNPNHVNSHDYNAHIWRDTGAHFNSKFYIHALVNQAKLTGSSSSITFTSTITHAATVDDGGTAVTSTRTALFVGDDSDVSLTNPTAHREAKRKWNFSLDKGAFFYSWTIGYNGSSLNKDMRCHDDGYTVDNGSDDGNHPGWRRWYICYNVFNCDDSVYFMSVRSTSEALDVISASSTKMHTYSFKVSGKNGLNPNQQFYINPTPVKVNVNHYLNGANVKLSAQTSLNNVYFYECMVGSSIGKFSSTHVAYKQMRVEKYNGSVKARYWREYTKKDLYLSYTVNLTSSWVKASTASFTYDGTEKSFAPTLTLSFTDAGGTSRSITLVEGTDYSLSGDVKATNAGTYSVTVTGLKSTNSKLTADTTKTISWTIGKASPTAIEPTIKSATANKVNATTLSAQKYMLTTSSTAPTTGTWTDGSGGDLSLGSFSLGTQYYLWTYVPGDSNHYESSKVSVPVSANYANYYYSKDTVGNKDIYITGTTVTPSGKGTLQGWNFVRWNNESSTEASATTMVMGGLNFYAYYEKDITATFVLGNGNSNETSKGSFTYDSSKSTAEANPSLVFTTPSVTYSDRELLGWAQESSNATDFSIGSLTTGEDVTYYAYWLSCDGRGVSEKPVDNKSFSVVASTFPASNVLSYEWYVINQSGATKLDAIGTSYSPSTVEGNTAYKCVVNYKDSTGAKSKTYCTAWKAGDIKVDADAVEKITSVSVNNTEVTINANDEYSFEFNCENALSAFASGNSSLEVKAYGIINGDYVLLNDSNISNRSVASLDTGVSAELPSFDRYKVVLKNTSGEDVVVPANAVKAYVLPRVYRILLGENGYKWDSTNYKFSFDNLGTYSLFTDARAKDGEDIHYYYGDDKIQISIPVDKGTKLTSGSYILVAGERVYPTLSVGKENTDGKYYVTFDVTNALDVVTKNADEKNIAFANTDLHIDVSHVSTKTDDSANVTHALNIGPLGADMKGTKLTFGALWYFDDEATKDSWTRKDGVGMYIVQVGKLLADAENNHFYNFVSNSDDEYAVFLKDYEYIGKKLDNIDLDTELSEMGCSVQEVIMKLLGQFIEEWNSESRTEKMSFGSQCYLDTVANYYYYVVDGNAEIPSSFMKFSASIDVSGHENVRLAGIPYTSYVKGIDAGFFAPVKAYPTNVYLYSAPDGVYSGSDFS